MLGYKQGGKYYSLEYDALGKITALTLTVAFSRPIFATAISDSQNDDIVPHIYAMSETTISVSMDRIGNGPIRTNVYLLAIGY